MKRYMLLISLGASTLFAAAQNKPLSITRQDYYDFFNSLSKPDSVFKFNLSSKPDFGPLSVKYILNDSDRIFVNGIAREVKDTTFSATDKKFIKQQLASGKNFRWADGKISGATIIDQKEINKYFKRKYDDGWKYYYKKYNEGYRTFSAPIFSADRTKCIVYKTLHCGGKCGTGYICIYVKTNGKWKLKQTNLCWTS